MKYLVIGDIHCRTTWKDIVAKESDYDKVIFLGDYLTPREVTLDDPTDVCGILYDILTFKEENPDKVILLRGNHDCSSLGYYWAECNPRDRYSEQYMSSKDVKDWFLSLSQWVYIIPDTNIVCSHAGISEEFLKSVEIEVIGSPDKEWDETTKNMWLISKINELEPSELFGFTPCKFSDYNGESATQPCTWIRPNSLFWHCPLNITQVVGHTPVKQISNIKKLFMESGSCHNIQDKPDIWLCDCLENGQYLEINDNKFIPHDLNK
jgi:hypothetical protein